MYTLCPLEAACSPAYDQKLCMRRLRRLFTVQSAAPSHGVFLRRLQRGRMARSTDVMIVHWWISPLSQAGICNALVPLLVVGVRRSRRCESVCTGPPLGRLPLVDYTGSLPVLGRPQCCEQDMPLQVLSAAYIGSGGRSHRSPYCLVQNAADRLLHPLHLFIRKQRAIYILISICCTSNPLAISRHEYPLDNYGEST